MDYLFFGINSLAAGFSALLIYQQMRPQNHLPLKLAHYLGMLFVIVAYYSLDQQLFAQTFPGYVLANILPIILLAGSLFTLLRPHVTTRS